MTNDPNERILTRKELTQSRARLRSSMNRDHEASERRAKQVASQLLSGEHVSSRDRRNKDRSRESFVYGVTNLAGRVLNSLNITPRINVSASSTNSDVPVIASTDFESISIYIDAQKFKLEDIDSMTELLHMTKGLVYHEGGHILYTTPLANLCERVGCNKKHQLPNHMALPEDIGNEAYQLLTSSFNGAVTHAWNILEDQRMETALVGTSPVMSRYLTTLVCKYVVNQSAPEISWPWLVGRTYLPREFRQRMRDIAETHKRSDLIPEINSVVMRYRRSNDAFEMHQCVLEMAVLIVFWMAGYANPSPIDQHRPGGFGGNTPGNKNVVKVPDPGEYNVEEPSPKPDGADTTGREGEGEEQDKQDSSRGDTSTGMDQSSNSPPSKNDRTAGHDTGSKTHSDIAKEIINQNVSQMSVNEVNSFISDVNHSRNSMAARDHTATPMTPSESRAVVDIKNGMLDVLDKLIIQVDPTWSFYQDDGVLDPTAYMTREPGDMNFWSGMDGDQGNGHDLAVSLLIDSSGSMDSGIDQVSITAMGIRRACEVYDIPCTITTFSDATRLVVAGDEVTDDVKVAAGGGTHILDAVTILDDQRYGKRYHLVVILTDGEWGDLKDVRIWSSPTRHIMLIGYDVPHEMLSRKGANSCVTISNLNELAPLVTNALAGYFQ